MLASVAAIKGMLTPVVGKCGSKFSEHETTMTQNLSVFLVFLS